MPDRELRGVARCLARLACRVCCWTWFAADKGAGYGGSGVGRRNVWREKERKCRCVSKIVGSVPYASAILPTMSQPTSAVSEVRASTVARTATPWLRAVTQLTRKLFRRTSPSTQYTSCQGSLLQGLLCKLRGPLRQQQKQHQAPFNVVMIKIVIHKVNAMPPTMRQPGRKRHGRCQCRE